jgi:hypothetical protein
MNKPFDRIENKLSILIILLLVLSMASICVSGECETQYQYPSGHHTSGHYLPTSGHHFSVAKGQNFHSRSIQPRSCQNKLETFQGVINSIINTCNPHNGPAPGPKSPNGPAPGPKSPNWPEKGLKYQIY